MAVDGGRVAARGFQYQYLRTLEALLERIDDESIAALRVEGGSGADGINTVDFDLTGDGGERMVAVQVKSRQPGSTMSASEAFGILLDLVVAVNAKEYQLITNAQAGPGMKDLVTALEAIDDFDELRRSLLATLAGAPSRASQVSQMLPSIIERFCRARVIVDDRDDIEIRYHLASRLRQFRVSAREGLGEQSAGLLLGFLISDVLRRAADEGAACLTRQEFRERLLVPGHVLAQSLAVRDWGVVVGRVPPIPDVPRPEIITRLNDVFAPSIDAGVRTAALVGLSGIGKSSQAAAYVANRADLYDLICWVDAESTSTLTASLRQVLAHIRGITRASIMEATPDELRDAVHTELSRYNGRWLIVFDNVTVARDLGAWLPAVGRGDVLITALDAATRFGKAATIPVEQMSRDEAVTLLRLRLDMSDAEYSSHIGLLERIVNAMGRWPLAIELATGYMHGCGIPIHQAHHYLDRLKQRALADDMAIPVGYPRTLVAAIDMCLDHVATLTKEEPHTLQKLAPLALMTAAAYTASRQIPIHLAAGALFAHDDELRNPDFRTAGPMFVGPESADLLEAVRELRRFSLVDFDEDLPHEFDSLVADGSRTIAVNTIVQDVIRRLRETHSGMFDLLNRLATLTNIWMTSSLHAGHVQLSYLMSTHAEALVENIAAQQLASPQILLLFGNFAILQRDRGNTLAAEQLWRLEMSILDQIEPVKDDDFDSELVTMQIKISLSLLFIDEETRTDVTIDEVIPWLQDSLMSAQRLALEKPDGAMELLTPLRNALHNPRGQSLIEHNEEIATLNSAFADLISRLPSTEHSDALDAFRQITMELQTGRDYENAERLCRYLIGKANFLGGPQELEARRLLIEVLIRLQRWADAKSEHDKIRRRIGATPMLPYTVNMMIHNVGCSCAAAYLLGETLDSDHAAKLLDDLLTWPHAKPISGTSDEYTQKFLLLAAINDLANGRLLEGDEKLSRVPRPEANEPHPTNEDLPSWRLLWEYTRLALLQRAWHTKQTYNTLD
ncbi:NB-ARC domain-containing protein [Stackebrandtia nassauensis]|uniref:NB-ARC domain-containing protein n=1 Tax=Stackebrandtia nassauensis (strain DSM 44728 / CIP 108903 / NRRL B-16338 / NBRC 102104 / LLR-40K-21) TaxID=446470 RepID=D3Q4L4_STANL|nr:NB-ARC domain-containing protein [Stackebrandtia nassauensis]ADD40174.1 hypothetical protein Snas_0459 [Stackebrandtia nassauensis DSM 44728]